jgi:hypothetical protein
MEKLGTYPWVLTQKRASAYSGKILYLLGIICRLAPIAML